MKWQEVDLAMKRLLKEAAEEIGVGMDVIETDRDHVHMLLVTHFGYQLFSFRKVEVFRLRDK